MTNDEKLGFFAKRKATKSAAERLHAEFRAIAKASFDKAMAEGVTETSPGSTVVHAPESQVYESWASAYLRLPDTYRMFTSNHQLESCKPWALIAEAESRRRKVDFTIEFDEVEETYSFTTMIHNLVKHTVRYQIADGLFIGTFFIAPEDGSTEHTELRFGALDEHGLKILHTAVDNWLASLAGAK